MCRRCLLPRKRSQVTIFIIIGVVIVVFATLAYFLYPTIKTNIGLSSSNPSVFMQSCLEDSIRDSIDILSEQGGSIDPVHYFLYNDNKLEYLCYSYGYYQTCVMQQPLLGKHVEGEIKNYILEDARDCMEALKTSFESRGYEVQMKDGDFEVEVLPKVVAVNFNDSLILKSKGTESYDSIKISVNSNIYELISIANSILNWEAKYGDAETTTYMNYYHNMKVEKKKQSDGTTVYLLNDRNTGDKFNFASRSLAWPPGHGAEGVY